MADVYCANCRSRTPVVLDYMLREVICSECGLVLQSLSGAIGTSQRSILADDSNRQDPPGVAAGPSNPLLHGGGPDSDTVSDKRQCASCDSLSPSNARWSQVAETESPPIQKFGSIRSMADGLGLGETITIHAEKLYKKMEDQKTCKGKHDLNALMAACLFYACQEKDSPRTVKEISRVSNRATIKAINRARKLARKKLKIVTSKVIPAGDLARRYCSRFGLNYHETKAVRVTVRKSEELDLRRTSLSVLAAVIYMTTQLSDNQMLSLGGLNGIPTLSHELLN